MGADRAELASRALLECVDDRFGYVARNAGTGELEVVYVARGPHAQELLDTIGESRRNRSIAARAIQWLVTKAAD
jgi:hypothetical protein